MRPTQAATVDERDQWSLCRAWLQLLITATSVRSRWGLVLVLLLTIAGAFAGALTPLSLKSLIDGLTHPGSTDALLPTVSGALYIFGLCLTRLIAEVRQYAQGRTEQALRIRVSAFMYAQVLDLPLRFHLDRARGSIVETVEQGIRGFQLLLGQTIGTAIPLLIELALICAVLGSQNLGQYRGPFILIACAYAATFCSGSTDLYRSAFEATRMHLSNQSIYAEALGGCETIKFLSGQALIAQRYRAGADSVGRLYARYYRLLLTRGGLQTAIFGVSVGAIVLLAVRDVASGRMMLGDFVLLHAFVLRLVQPLESIGSMIRLSAQSLSYVNALLSLIAQPGEFDEIESKRMPASRRVVFDNVCLKFEPGQSVVSGISFELSPGKTIGLVGSSGSGKSTLIRLLFRLYEPTSGSITMDGVPLQKLSLQQLRRSIAVVPQDVVLFNDSIANNIAFGLQVNAEQIRVAADAAGLKDLIERLPDGYDTVIGERGQKLSGGERQRIAIARALLRQVSICVLDEATASLDALTEEAVMRSTRAALAGCATLIVSHRLSAVVQADEILCLHQGRIVERGSHAELLLVQGRYARMWMAQNPSATKASRAM